LTTLAFAQKTERQVTLDSLNKAREADRGAFNLYIKKFKAEVIAGVFRNRESALQGFEPINFTYAIYLPFQLDLNYVNQPAHDKLLKLNTVLLHTIPNTATTRSGWASGSVS
jgi:hypothetical protein